MGEFILSDKKTSSNKLIRTIFVILTLAAIFTLFTLEQSKDSGPQIHTNPDGSKILDLGWQGTINAGPNGSITQGKNGSFVVVYDHSKDKKG